MKVRRVCISSRAYWIHASTHDDRNSKGISFHLLYHARSSFHRSRIPPQHSNATGKSSVKNNDENEKKTHAQHQCYHLKIRDATYFTRNTYIHFSRTYCVARTRRAINNNDAICVCFFLISGRQSDRFEPSKSDTHRKINIDRQFVWTSMQCDYYHLPSHRGRRRRRYWWF